MYRLALSLVLLLAGGAVSAQPSFVVEDAFPGVTFASPVGVELAPGQDTRAYVIEQGGTTAPPRVLTLESGDAAPTVFLDLSDRASSRDGTETGLIGLAFHPDYAENGRLFVHYTAPVATSVPGERVLLTRISEFTRSATDPLAADPASERILLEADQPARNHNGGKIAFGPDGHLSIALGDGGGADDEFGQGQDPTTLLGALLRIDVDDVPDGAAYGIPDGNPFALTDGPERDEIYAWGLRNPWKFSIASDGAIWLADVGQRVWEEVNRIEAGRNYGWNTVEGPDCFPETVTSCDLSGLAAPEVWYAHDAQGGFSITGGYVVEQGGTGALEGHYLYGDFVSGRMWAYRPGASPQVILESVPAANGGTRTPNIAAIDPAPPSGPLAGEPLLVDYAGTIHVLRLATIATDEGAPAASAPRLRLGGANPFATETRVEVEARPGTAARVTLADALGRTVAVLHDGPVPAGTFRLPVDGRPLAPGVYHVRLATEAGQASVPVVRVR
ncbi:MAG: PQQ-dependent sugar dehydrogenase [Bacteroidota bacterium]